MDIRQLNSLGKGIAKPLPTDRIYLTLVDLAERYEVSTRTIKRWMVNMDSFPLTIDSEYTLNRWDIEELKEFEDEIKQQIESLSKSNT